MNVAAAAWALGFLAAGAPRAQQPATDAPHAAAPGGLGVAQEEPAANAASVAPEGRLSPRYVAPLALEDIEREIQELALAHPGLARREVLGTSREGRAIPLLVLTGAESPDTDKPGLLVVGDRGSAPLDEAEAEAALAFAWSVVSGDDPELARLSSQASLYVVPVLDPDARVLREDAGHASLEQDFPCGWQPPPGGSRTSSIPLSRPEALAAARFLAERTNVTLVLGRLPEPVWDPEPGRDPEPGIPSEDAATYGELFAVLDAPGAAGWGFPTVPAGTLFDYAYFAQGVFAAGWRAATLSGALEGEHGAEAFEVRVGERVRQLSALARELPRLELALAEPVPSSSGVWCLDVRVANAAGLPTESALSAGRRADRGIVLAVRGARVMASALREAEPGPFRLPAQEHGSAGLLRLGRLAPHGERWVRLLLEAAPGAEVTVEARGACAASVAQTVLLP